MGTRGGAGQELYRKLALKLGRDATKQSRSGMGGADEGSNLQRESEQRMVGQGAKRPGTGRRGSQKVK